MRNSAALKKTAKICCKKRAKGVKDKIKFKKKNQKLGISLSASRFYLVCEVSIFF